MSHDKKNTFLIANSLQYTFAFKLLKCFFEIQFFDNKTSQQFTNHLNQIILQFYIFRFFADLLFELIIVNFVCFFTSSRKTYCDLSKQIISQISLEILKSANYSLDHHHVRWYHQQKERIPDRFYQ